MRLFPPPAAAARAAPPTVLGLALVLALAFQGSRGLWEPDEGRYAAVAIEMLRTGDWLTPRLNHEVLHLSKPPLTYWAIAGSVALFGPSEWAVRLPHALAFVATVWLVGRLGRRLAHGRGDLAALVHATALLPFVAANIATTDTLLAAATALGTLGFVEAWFAGDSAAPRGASCRFGLGFGLAFLVKGPPGLLPLLGIALFVLLARGRRSTARLDPVPALAVFALVAVPWYAWQIHLRPEVLDYWWRGEVAGRLAGDHGRNTGFWSGVAEAYLPVLLLGMQPWATPAAMAGWRALRDEAKRRSAFEAPEARLLALLVLVPLGVLFASRSRLPLYILPLAAPASVWIARALADRPARDWHRRALAAWCLALVGIKAYSGWHATDRDARRAAQDLAARLAPRLPHEVLFVDERPMWGLSFYLPAEAEWIELQPAVRDAPSLVPLHEAIDEEVLEREEHLALLARPSRAEATIERFRAAGWSVESLGSVARRSLYWLEPPGAPVSPAAPAPSPPGAAPAPPGRAESAARSRR